MSLLELKKVSKLYRNHFWDKQVPAVTDLSFSVREKSVTGFIGPNGAGKTTCIKMLLGLTRPTNGSAFIRGVPSDKPEARRKVAFVSEQPYFYRHLTVRESLTFVYTLNKFPAEKLTAEIDRVLHTVQLADKSDIKIHTMSKGMQQRLNMAHALLGGPDIYIFDEPMSGLDPLGRRLFRGLFHNLAKNEKCVFFSTHILEDIESLCDQVIVLDKGKKVYAGGVNELLSRNTAGTEVRVAGLTDGHMAGLGTQGYEITDLDEGHHVVFVPADKSVESCQKYLYANNIFPSAIHPRAASLESILYANNGGEG